MTQQISIIDQLGFAESKATRKEMAEVIVNNVSEGLTDPLQVHYHLKCLEDLIKQVNVNDTFKEALISEANKYGRSFEFKNSKMEIRETGIKYDYNTCNDPEWHELNNEIEFLQDKIKAREKFLKTIRHDGMNIFDEKTGETYTIFPPAVRSTTSIAVTLK